MECRDAGWPWGQNVEPCSNPESFHRKASYTGDATALSRGSYSGEADIGSGLSWSRTVLGGRSAEDSKAEEPAARFVPGLQAFSIALGLWGFLVTDPATLCLQPSKVHFSAYSHDSIGHLGNGNS